MREYQSKPMGASTGGGHFSFMSSRNGINPPDWLFPLHLWRASAAHITKEPRCLRVRYRKHLYIHPRTFCSTIAVKEKKMNVLTVPLSWHRRALPKIFPLSHSLHSLICFGIFLACDSIKRGSDGSGTVSAYSQPKRNVTQKPE